MTDQDFNPLRDEVRQEIPLPQAPLVRVLCQVRFGDVIMVRDPGFIGPFQERLRRTYPVTKREDVQTFGFNPSGLKMAEDIVWRFADNDDAWRVSLGTSFLSFETRKYTSRDDFVTRLSTVLGCLQQTVAPTSALRAGMRYVDQVSIEKPTDMASMLRSEMGGVTALQLAEGALRHSISEIGLSVPEGGLQSKWGVLPALATHDPEMMPPVDSMSWFLDTDVWTEYKSGEMAFEAEPLAAAAEGLAKRCYSFFRWATTDAFLRRFGGSL